jgi:nitrogen fixation protein NifU and related proteins
MDRDVGEADTREALYQQLIMERARRPLHAGVLDPADAAADGNNPFCGDRVHVTLSLSSDGRVSRLLHRTRGCAICMASADLMAESVEGLEPGAIRSLFGQFDAMLQGGTGDSVARSGPAGAQEQAGDLGLLEAFENLHEYRSRIRCATLPWTALLDALKSERTM